MSETKPVRDERVVEFVPLGCADKIKLSVRIVQNIIAKPTRSGRTCSDNDAIKFIMLCSAQRLNPFLGDCFLVGYDGQNGPEFSMISSYHALLKRAEVHPRYQGLEFGVIVKEGDALKDLQGDFHTEDQLLLGGWARVHVDGLKVPIADRLMLKNFLKKTSRGDPTQFWQQDPEGQIVKCAQASVLRTAFPNGCGGMYLREEISLLGEGIGVIATPDFASAHSASPAATAPKGNEDDSNPELAPARIPGVGTGKPAGESVDSPQAQLAALAQENGLSFDAYQRWGVESGNDSEASARADWSEIPGDTAKRLLRARQGFVSGVKKFQKGGGQ